MSDERLDHPLRAVRRALDAGWHALLTVYYANSVPWRALKTGALVFLGFFLWAGSNVLLSYRADWTLLHYAAAYGALLVVYGPLHHLVVIPVYLRLRKRGTRLSLGGHLTLPNAGLVAFLVAVVLVATLAPSLVLLDFQSTLEGAGVDVDPDLLCVRSTGDGDATVHCHLSESAGVDRVVVRSGQRTLLEDAEPPFEFTVRAADLDGEGPSRRFRVELQAADGTLVRQYTRSLGMIDETS